jgi:hypothetical protein
MDVHIYSGCIRHYIYYYIIYSSYTRICRPKSLVRHGFGAYVQQHHNGIRIHGTIQHPTVYVRTETESDATH